MNNNTDDLKCTACKLGVSKVKNNAELENKVVETVSDFVIYLCEDKYKIFPDYICEGLVHE